MDFLELAKKRYSVRSYLDRKVEAEKLEKILQAAHVAPTAANRQPIHIIAVQEKEGLEKIGKSGGGDYRKTGASGLFGECCL